MAIGIMALICGAALIVLALIYKSENTRSFIFHKLCPLLIGVMDIFTAIIHFGWINIS